MTTKLTDKQRIFVKEYLIDLNATQAAIRAGYSKDTAQQIGSENLTKPVISDAIAEAKAKREEKLDIDAQWVLKEAVDAVGIFKEKGDSALVSALKLVAQHVDVDALAAGKNRFVDSKGNDRGLTIDPSGISESALEELLNAATKTDE